MKERGRYTCNYQLAGYDFDCRDEMGDIDFPMFAAAFESFSWGGQMRQREKMAGGCSATISVEDGYLNRVCWVSVTGSDIRPTFLLGAVHNRKLKKSHRHEFSGLVRWNETRVAPSRRSVHCTFRIFFTGDNDKWLKQFGTYRLFSRPTATPR